MSKLERYCELAFILLLGGGLVTMSITLYYFKQYQPAVDKYNRLILTPCTIIRNQTGTGMCYQDECRNSIDGERIECYQVEIPCSALIITWQFRALNKTYHYIETVTENQNNYRVGVSFRCYYLPEDPEGTLRFDDYSHKLGEVEGDDMEIA